MELTPEQLAIIEAGDVDLAVTAGAGSGKTHVLVERYVRLLDRYEVPQLVAVTFTEAAAAEMRQRVRREVMTRETLARHRAGIDDAMIGTIHSLCLRLLREHPIEAALDPASGVLADDEAELLRRAACIAAVDAAAESLSDATEVLRTLGIYHTGLLLPAMLSARDEVRAAFLASTPPTILRAQMDADCERALGVFREVLPRILAEAWTYNLDPADKLADVVKAAIKATAVPSPDIQHWTSQLREFVSIVRGGGGRQSAWSILPADVRGPLFAARSLVEDALKDAPLWNEYDEVVTATLPSLRALFEDACARYEAAKHERGGLDFLDLELRAVALLEQSSAVLEACRKRYRHVTVDEAQDVSPLQAQLFRLLTDGDDSPRLSLVGDEKQSIYSFRGADVAQFRALQAAVEARGGTALTLSTSFRTHVGLVAHTNELFGRAFADDAELAMAPMTGRPTEPPDGPHLVVERFEVLSRDAEETRERRLAEAEWVASEIERLLREGRSVWDKAAGAYRPALPRDVAVLLRRFRNVHLFEQALEAHAVVYATPSGTGFFSRQEVLDLENLIRWLAEPDDDLALVALLRSPFFIVSDDALYRLRNGPRRALLSALREPPADLEAADRERCTFAAGVLNDLRRAARTESAVDLLEAALEATGFEASWAPVSGGEQALANIRKLVRIVRTLAGFTLSEVADYLEQRREDLDTREGPAVLDRPDAVQLMTVHGAKGLEFPVVFVPEAHMDPSPPSPAVRWHRDAGISFTLERDEEETVRGRPGAYTYLRSTDLEAERHEHLRLFYVAATRAGDYLYVSGDEAASGWLSTIQTALDAGALGTIEVRRAVAAGSAEVARLRVRSTVAVPAAEVPYTPPLLARPPIIPLRSSTPVTALRLDEPHRYGGIGDGLGLIRGRIVHRALEALHLAGAAPNLETIVTQEAAEATAEVRAALTEDARAMLAQFAASEVGRAIADPTAEPRFEVPFAWDWDGIPVHGQIDLLYRTGAGWRVVDFKTDRVRGAVDAAARPYLVQIGIYARALEAATGVRPSAGLLFVRDGSWYEPSWAEIDAELAAARTRIDAGLMLDPELADYLGSAED